MIIRKYDKEIYNVNVIHKAMAAYIDYADISIEETKSDYVCSFMDCKYEDNLTVNEFSNYIIACMNMGNIE